MAKKRKNNFGTHWSEREFDWSARMHSKGKDAETIADALNRRYHGGKKVRTVSAVKQCIIKQRHKNKTPSTALAVRGPDKVARRSKKKKNGTHVLTSEVIDNVPTRLFQLKLPGLSIQVQIEGENGTDEMITEMARNALPQG